MDYSKLTLKEIIELLQAKKITSLELTAFYIKRISKFKDKNAVLEVFEDALLNASIKDAYSREHKKLPILHGVPILIKDNLAYAGHKMTCSSKMLQDYVPRFSATVIKKLLKLGVVIIGRTNMDELAMGGSTENSAFGVTKNAFDDTRVAGGSSGGSACAVALGLCAFALGSDTGGSIRQPSSFNGVVGLKPTYGRVSRYGLVPFADSLDTVGPIAKTSEDCAIVLNAIAGKDQNDPTCSLNNPETYLKKLNNSIKGKVFGVPTEILNLIKQTPYTKNYQELFKLLSSSGATVKEISIDSYETSLAAYYILSPAEASSNLGTLDGIKFTKTYKDAKNISDLVSISRTKYLGSEVRRRIMLGNFVLSSGYYDAYYAKAKKFTENLKADTIKALETCDAILMPTTYGEAFKINEKTKDPVTMYAEDMFTIFANLTGVPAISVPFSKGENGLPLGVQILGKHFDEASLLGFANFIEKSCKEAK